MLNEATAFQRLTQLAIGNHVGCGVFPRRVTGCAVLSKSVVALSHIENLIKKRSMNAHVFLMDSQDVDVMTNHIITLLTLQNHSTTFCLVVAIQLVESFNKIWILILLHKKNTKYHTVD